MARRSRPYYEKKPHPLARRLRPALRREVAGMIVRRNLLPAGPAVPSAVAYEERRHGNAPSKAFGQWTHSRKADTRTVREQCIC